MKKGLSRRQHHRPVWVIRPPTSIHPRERSTRPGPAPARRKYLRRSCAGPTSLTCTRWQDRPAGPTAHAKTPERLCIARDANWWTIAWSKPRAPTWTVFARFIGPTVFPAHLVVTRSSCLLKYSFFSRTPPWPYIACTAIGHHLGLFFCVFGPTA